MMFDSARHIHFVGIGGIGMSALALLLQRQDKVVSGSDQSDSKLLDSLREAGISISIGNAAQHVAGADLLVYSSAVKPDNPERLYAEQHQIPEIRRAELLGAIARKYSHTLAVAGTHGKTTTTGMAGSILSAANLDPSMLVGGILPNLKSNLLLGGTDHLVVEADEYDRSFLALSPDRIIVTTLEADHLDIYSGIQDLRDTFLKFISGLAPDGLLVLQGDDAELRHLAERVTHPVTSYGFSQTVDYRAVNLVQTQFTAAFDMLYRGSRLGRIQLAMPGKHNILNALAAAAMAHEMGIDFSAIQQGLATFSGVERRFQLRGSRDGVQFIDDYAHHPSELQATLEAARNGWPSSRVIAVFQPHLFSRTRDFATDFARALRLADLAIVTDIYPAREKPLPGVTSDLIVREAPELTSLKDIAAVYDYLKPRLKAGDLLITMGAGDIWKLHNLFLGDDSQ